MQKTALERSQKGQGSAINGNITRSGGLTRPERRHLDKSESVWPNLVYTYQLQENRKPPGNPCFRAVRLSWLL